MLSWFYLKAKCRSCRKSISILYPLIELLTVSLFLFLYWYIDSQYWIGYGIFFTALIISIRTDFEKMLISRLVTLFLIPVPFLLSAHTMLPITLGSSVAGAIFGYCFLWIVAFLFYYFREIEGLGQGDLDLLALIGSFTGIAGAWFALFLGAFFGSFAGVILLLRHPRKTLIKVAFGPWLALGAILYVFFQSYFLQLF